MIEKLSFEFRADIYILTVTTHTGNTATYVYMQTVVGSIKFGRFSQSAKINSEPKISSYTVTSIRNKITMAIYAVLG